MVKNRFKSDSAEDKVSKKTTASKSKKSKKASNLKKPFENVFSFFRKEKTKQAIGLLFILFSAYLLIAFTSFLFTWKVDQSQVELPFWEYFFNPEITVENWLGKIGASLSHLFIYSWFGIASFLFVGLFFLIGFRVLFKVSLLPLVKTFKISIFVV